MGDIIEHNTRQADDENLPRHCDEERTHLNIDLIPIVTADTHEEMIEAIDEALEPIPDHEVDTDVEPANTPKCMERVRHYDATDMPVIKDTDNDRTGEVKKTVLEEVEKADERKREAGESNRGLQDNQNRMTEHIFTTSPEWFRPDDPDEHGRFDNQRLREWLIGTCDRIRKTYENDSRKLVSANVHLDEATPHAHTIELPFSEDNLLRTSDIYFPQRLSEMQTDYANRLPGGIERGERGSERKHLTKMEKMYKDLKDAKKETAEVKGVLADAVERIKSYEVEPDEVDKLLDLADTVRENVDPEELRIRHEYIKADRANYENPIDYLTENTKLGVPEAIKIGVKSLASKSEHLEKKVDRLEEELEQAQDSSDISEQTQDPGPEDDLDMGL